MNISFKGPVIGQTKTHEANKTLPAFRQTPQADEFVQISKKQATPAFKGFIDYICGKPLVLFWNPHSDASLDHIVEQNDAGLAAKLVKRGNLNQFPKIRQYLVEKVVDDIDEPDCHADKMKVLKAINAEPELVALGKETHEPLYTQLVNELRSMVSVFR